MLSTKRHHQLLIRLFLARIAQHAHMGLTAIERLASFTKTARESIVDECEFEHALESFENGHAAFGGGGIGGDFDFVGGGDGGGGGGLFSVRLCGRVLAGRSSFL